MNPAGIVPVVVACASKSNCQGTVTLLTRVGGAHASRRSRPMVLGHKDFEITAGRHKRVRVRLSRRARMLVSRHRKLRVKLSAAVQQDGRTVTTTRTVTLRAPKKSATRKR
jgi:hypothetical protein